MNNKIKGIEKIELMMGEWNPCALAIIETFELKKTFDSLSVDMVMNAIFQPRSASWPDFNKEMFRIKIIFNSVNGLCLKDFGGGVNQIMGFDIRYIGDRGWERVNFEIEDYEDDRIRFNCKGIEIKSIESMYTLYE